LKNNSDLPFPCAMQVFNDRKQIYVWGRPAVTCGHKECYRCAWNHEEAQRRAQIPLTLCPDGLRRKIIPPKPKYGESEEGPEEEQEDSDNE